MSESNLVESRKWFSLRADGSVENLDLLAAVDAAEGGDQVARLVLFAVDRASAHERALGGIATKKVQDRLDSVVAAARGVVQFRYQMSYNSSYFGEAEGLLKARVADLDRTLPTVKTLAFSPRESVGQCRFPACRTSAGCSNPCQITV